MKLSEAKAIRAEIVRLCPFGHKARNISKRVMQSLANEREDASIILGGVQNLSNDYEIDTRYSTQLKRAFDLAKGGN